MTITAENLHFKVFKEIDDYFITLQRKTLPLIANVIPENMKLGVKCGAISGNKITVFQRVNKRKEKAFFKLVGSFKPTLIEKDARRVVYYRKMYIHKDILKGKSEIQIFFENGETKIYKKGINY